MLKHQNSKLSGNYVNSNPSQTTIVGLLSKVLNTQLFSVASHACINFVSSVEKKNDFPLGLNHTLLRPHVNACVINGVKKLLAQQGNICSLLFTVYIK